jgi:hypothetical protein
LKKIFVVLILAILSSVAITSAQDTTDPLGDFFNNLGFTVEESSEPTAETAAGETLGEPPYESSLEPPYCNETGTDGFAPCGSRYDNECNDGGELEGKCDSSDLNFDGVVEDWEIVYMWDFGWALARYNQGLISREDFTFQSMLPPLPGEIDNGRAGRCLDAGISGDVSYVGPANMLGNAVAWGSFDGSCSLVTGVPGTPAPTTIVTASNASEALSICISLGIDTSAASNLIMADFPTADPDWWFCVPN